MSKLSAMSGQEIQTVFPSCVHPSEWFGAYLAALLGMVVLTLCLKRIKDAAEI